MNDFWVQAFRQLKADRLRTLLSLLGVSIGIFSIVVALTLVDSLQTTVRDSFAHKLKLCIRSDSGELLCYALKKLPDINIAELWLYPPAFNPRNLQKILNYRLHRFRLAFYCIQRFFKLLRIFFSPAQQKVRLSGDDRKRSVQFVRNVARKLPFAVEIGFYALKKLVERARKLIYLVVPASNRQKLVEFLCR